jgi:iron complex transport system ATP-binding protein
LSILEVKGLQVGFDVKPLISNLSFKIQSPTFVAIIGHNGCGKSTFFRSLIHQHPYLGFASLNGVDIASIKNLPATGLITLLEQKNSINFSISVKDLVLMGRFRFKKFFENYSKQDLEIVEQVLKDLHIEYLADKDFLTLSGGEQQLVWFAQLMVQDSKVLLLDEPTQQLDVFNRKKIFDLMQFLAYDKQKLVLTITHDLWNLTQLKGFILNLSLPNPVLEELSPEVVEKHYKLLEEKIPCSIR